MFRNIKILNYSDLFTDDSIGKTLVSQVGNSDTVKIYRYFHIIFLQNLQSITVTLP